MGIPATMSNCISCILDWVWYNKESNLRRESRQLRERIGRQSASPLRGKAVENQQ